jgi:hypothetical protein
MNSKYFHSRLLALSTALVLIAVVSCLVAPHALADQTQSSQPPLENTSLDNNKKSPSRYVQMPIFYMTDREVGRRVFSAGRKEERDNIYDLYCGQLDYVMSNYKQKDASVYKDTLGWEEASKPGKLPFKNRPIKCAPEEDVYEKFGQAVAQAAKQSGSNEIFICVHGFNTSFAIAARDAARIAYNVQRPVILYSWPSTAKLLQYAVDSGNNEWSQEHFNHLMEELITVKEETGVKINLVAHSMGNRLAVRSVPIIAGKQLFQQVFLVDPDFDAETFFHYVVRYTPRLKPNAQEPESKMQVRILFSRKDRALPVAQVIFGGYTRLGQAADTMIETMMNPVQVPDLLEETAHFVGKLNPLASNTSTAITIGMRQRMRDQFEWIDFTKIDRGIIGHSIPFEMIASLWSTGKPGSGLAFVADKDDKVSGITRMIAKNFKLKERISQLGNCQKVVLVKAKTKNDSASKIVSSGD